MGPQNPKPAAPPKSGRAAQPTGFLDWLASLFLSSDPERQKQRQLRELAAELKRARPRYFNPAQGTAEPAMARFFWDIYRAVAAGQVLLKGAETSGALKSVLVDLTLTKETLALRERLTEQSIDERSRKATDPAALAAEVKEELRQFLEGFDANAMAEIDALYNRLLVLIDLIGFDYYYLLRKFDAGMPERDFVYAPRFTAIEGAQVLEELQDFLEILPNVDPDSDWDRMLSILKEHRGVEVVSRDGLRKAVQLLREAQRSGSLLKIVRYLTQNPEWKAMVRVHRENIVEPYLSKIKAEAEATVQKATSGRRNEKIEELARLVFGTGSVARLTNYSEKANPEFAQSLLGGFVHVSSLNYLRAFLTDHLQTGIREVINLLLIKGKWANKETSQEMSEAFHQLLKQSETISLFDADLAEDGETGRRLKTMALRSERDRRAVVQLRMILRQINDEAHAMILDSIQQLVAIARVLKTAHDDCVRPNPSLLINWKELKPSTDRDIRTLIAGVYKKIYNFVQLMQMLK
ncbi:MAG TPA: DUF5312 family protein [Spirochaetia bacterium]|nr:DUF5312 family protein [Spirochaetia bacterium]